MTAAHQARLLLPGFMLFHALRALSQEFCDLAHMDTCSTNSTPCAIACTAVLLSQCHPSSPWFAGMPLCIFCRSVFVGLKVTCTFQLIWFVSLTWKHIHFWVNSIALMSKPGFRLRKGEDVWVFEQHWDEGVYVDYLGWDILAMNEINT